MSFAEQEEGRLYSTDTRAPKAGVSTRTVARPARGRIVRKEGKASRREEERWHKVR